MPAILLTLYSRSYCHLCQQMQDALHSMHAEHRFTLDVVDIDADPALVERYDELVPVLVGRRQGQPSFQLCHYFLDEQKVLDFLVSGLGS